MDSYRIQANSNTNIFKQWDEGCVSIYIVFINKHSMGGSGVYGGRGFWEKL